MQIDINKINKVFRSLLGLIIFAGALTTLFLSMRAVMGVGGFCAEGGPYEIATPCPEGVALLTPLSIFGLFIGGGLYISALFKNGPQWHMLAWSALFISLGWNFLEFGIMPPEGDSLVFGWLIPGVLFEVMGIVPLWALKSELSSILFGKNDLDVKYRQLVLVTLHITSAIGGILLGYLMYQWAS